MNAPSITSARLKLLGLPCVVAEEAELPLNASRPMQLLVRLAVRGVWQSRDELANLFWPDRETALARSNLRNLLCKTLAAAPFALIESTEHALRLMAPSDLAEFDSAIQQSDWTAAVPIGAGELLQGFESNATEPYLQWLQSEREATLARWKQAVRALLGHVSTPTQQRAALAQTWAARCPLDEDAVQVLVALALEQHQPGTAARLYREFEARLQREFGVRPSRALERLALMTPTMAAVSNAAPTPGVPASPPQAMPRRSKIFGRRLELRELGALLSDPAIRLTTLTGPGGVGKSTLMGALHEQCVAQGELGVCLVDASAATDAQGVIVAIAAALRAENPQGDAKEVALAATLGDRPCLLMIDGAEQAGLAGPLSLLLDRCPQVRVLVASRRRLQLDIERVVALEGFPLPDAEETDPQVMASSDAYGYFAAAMNKAGQPMVPARDARTVAALVRAVDGLPLALKLLAQLTPLFSLQQLLDSVRQHVAGAHEADAPAIGELLPALVASFQRSWATLAPLEQSALARLAVFSAPFDVAAARAVGRTELPVITSLIDASLVRSAGAGRLSLHAAIRACVLAARPLTDDCHAAYLEHYRQRIAALAGQAWSRTVRPLLQFLRSDGVHVEQAWEMAQHRRDMPTLLSLTESMWFKAGGYGIRFDWNARFVAAEARVRNEPHVPPALQVLLSGCAARAALDDGQYETAAEKARATMRAAQRRRHRAALMFAMDTLIRALLSQQRQEEAMALMDRFAAMCERAAADEFFSETMVTHQRLLCDAQGDTEAELRLIEQSLTIQRRRDDPDSLVLGCLAKAYVCGALGDLPRGIDAAEEALRVAVSSEAHPSLQVAALLEGSVWLVEVGRVDQAQAWIERADNLVFNHPQALRLRMLACLAHAKVSMAEQDLDGATRPLADALAYIASAKSLIYAEPIFLLAAKWFSAMKEREVCVELLRAITPQAPEMSMFTAAQAMLQDLGAQTSPQSGAQPGRSVADVPDFANTAAMARRRLLQLAERLRQPGQPA